MSLRYVLLTLLNQNASTGYEIVKSFETSVGYFWSASHQQVYRELGTLAEKKWVVFETESQADKPDKKIYSINQTGRAELMKWLATPLPPPTVREAILVKLLSADVMETEILRAELTQMRARDEQVKEVYLGIESEYYTPRPDSHAPLQQRMLYHALRRGILGAEARLQWVDEVLETLSDV